MEYQDFDAIIVLKVRSICCAAYKKKLKKEFSKLDGVYSVDINPEKSLVSVRGKVDANSLLNIVARTGKHAEIVSFSKKPSRSKRENHRGHSCCRDHNNGHEVEAEAEQHRCEDYAPPPLFDEGRCRDFCCNRPQRMPESEYSRFFGDFPQHSSRHFRHDPWWFVEEPPLQPPTGYGFRRRRHVPGFDDYGYFSYENAGGCIVM